MRTRTLASAALAASLTVVFPTMASAQSNTVSVRLYGLHPEQYAMFIARDGNLQLRTCSTCPSSETHQVAVRAYQRELLITDDLGNDQVEVKADQLFVDGVYRIEPQQGMKIKIAAPVQISAHDGLLDLIATLPLEDYVAAVLQGESATSSQQENLKAMAVVVRTYAVHFRPRHGKEGFDFCDNTHCQNLNFTGPTPAIRAAVEATRGELLWFQGSPAATYYHQNCGGTLAAGEEVWPTVHAPYLRQHDDPYCKVGAPLPWKAEFTRGELEKALRAHGLAVPQGWTSLSVESRGASGRAARLIFRSELEPPQPISASSLRFAIGRSFGWNHIRSDLYEIENAGDSVIFNGRGAGHGVGLCQAGAEEMARQGKTYKEILSFYYPGTELGRNGQGLAWTTRDTALFELKSTQPDDDQEVLTTAASILEKIQSELAWTLNFKVQLRVFPSLDTYRNVTGQPGWIAAYTRGRTISLQPLPILKTKGILESTIRHEFIHLLVESRARPDIPLWFREGLVIYLTDPNLSTPPVTMTERQIEVTMQHAGNEAELHKAYAAARTRVVDLVRQNGRDTVLHWLSVGLPDGVSGLPAQHGASQQP